KGRLTRVFPANARGRGTGTGSVQAQSATTVPPTGWLNETRNNPNGLRREGCERGGRFATRPNLPLILLRPAARKAATPTVVNVLYGCPLAVAAEWMQPGGECAVETSSSGGCATAFRSGQRRFALWHSFRHTSDLESRISHRVPQFADSSSST